METNKKNYVAPHAEQYVVIVEGVLCQSPGAGNESYAGDPSDGEMAF